MSTDPLLDDAKKGVEIIADIVKAAGDHPDVKQSGAQLAKTALTLTKAINVALLPLAAMNFGVAKAKEYFEAKFPKDIAAAAAHIPPEHVVEPKPSLAGPALQALAFAHEEVDLANMYLTLMATAMDGRVASKAHPAFVEIIRQLQCAEARLLRDLMKSYAKDFAVAQLRVSRHNEAGYEVVSSHIIDFDFRTSESSEGLEYEPMVDNWVRLGLITVEYDVRSFRSADYEWVRRRPEYQKSQQKYVAGGNMLSIGRGLLSVTAFGRQFAQAVGIG